jgi:predicted DNA repair protein MutK
MAGASLLTLLDDIASVLDDVALMTKVAAKKTAGVLGDDLALNAEQVSGVRAERELPVVWAVAKGSFLQQAHPGACRHRHQCSYPLAHHPAPDAGGAYLCFEGAEKLVHKFLPHEEEAHQAAPVPEDLAAYERQKVKGAIRTDFILSAEIIVIALGTVQGVEPGPADRRGGGHRPADDRRGLWPGGAHRQARRHRSAPAAKARWRRRAPAVGQGLLVTAPRLMHLLALVGTIAAMFMVGGGILVHGWPFLHHLIDGGHGGRLCPGFVVGGYWPW